MKNLFLYNYFHLIHSKLRKLYTYRCFVAEAPKLRLFIKLRNTNYSRHGDLKVIKGLICNVVETFKPFKRIIPLFC